MAGLILASKDNLHLLHFFPLLMGGQNISEIFIQAIYDHALTPDSGSDSAEVHPGYLDFLKLLG